MSAGAGSVNPVDEFENNFQACLAALTNPDYYNVRDSEEVKTGVEQTIQKFLDAAKNMECFFLQKRLLLSVQKPDHIILENINELKNELTRKEQLLNKYYEKIPNWQNQLQDVPGGVARPPPSTVATPPHQMGPMMQTAPMSNVSQAPPTVPGQQGHPHLVTLPHSISQPPPPMPSTATPSGGMMLQNPQMPHPQSHMVQAQQQGGLQGPLAYLERTMSNIGIPDGTR